NNSIVAAGDHSAVRLATAVSIIGRYMWLLVFPHPLSFDYSYNTIPLVSFSDPTAQVSLGVIILLAFIAARGFRSRSILSWSLVFIGATLAPVSNIVMLMEATLAERFLYMPSVGFCVAVAVVAVRLFNVDTRAAPYAGVAVFARSNALLLSVIAILVAIYGVKTVSRNALWRGGGPPGGGGGPDHTPDARKLHAVAETGVWGAGGQQGGPP